MNTRCRLAVAFLLLLAPLTASHPVNAEESLERFVTVRGDQLMVGERPLRFISFNIPNLLVVEDAFEFTDSNPWGWPDEFEIEDALESVRQMGGQVVRTYVISVYRDGSDMGKTVHVRSPGVFNEEGFRALDKVLEVAGRKGIRVIIPLVDNWKWMGGIAEYAAFRGKQPADFWSDPELIADFKQTIEYVINRENTYTGRRYRDDPAILGWETGNEIDSTPEWTREIAAYIKELDPNHLVIDGRSLHGVPTASLDDPNVDVITTHHYPHPTPDFVRLIRAAHAQTKGKKPYFVGEFGFVETPRIAAVLEATIDDGISGALLWSLRFHRREGGFYWHSEPGQGRDTLKSFHWPGFDSGALYDECEVMAMMRAQGFAIQGREPPPLKPPAPPTLLPIEHPALISWQGSAGASGYDVERAESANGPWDVVGRDVSDADVQYRPLFCDESALPGELYFYRVVARNHAGESEPSNIVGPVEVRSRMLVDECVDLSRLAESAGEVTVESDNARRMQEDAHRFALPTGSHITYRTAAPIRRWRVYCFKENVTGELEFAASSDGEAFVAIEATRTEFGSGPGDYGYWTPVMYDGTFDAATELTHLRITQGSGDAGSVEVSRVEVEFDSFDQRRGN